MIAADKVAVGSDWDLGVTGWLCTAIPDGAAPMSGKASSCHDANVANNSNYSIYRKKKSMLASCAPCVVFWGKNWKTCDVVSFQFVQ
jgi:hypothetical protein